MKKSIIAAALLILSAGILPSCTKEPSVKPTATFEKSTTANKKDVGTAD
ncbi:MULTISPECIES: hypothetical protein [unclassified Mucilaginibacter]|nr:MULTISPECIES: hypothetical protein [unclassified Mucilaginibacter]MBB5394002.1 hypothetical protein [Mucilaginibacter sp. AK015]QHS57598.1 hypothetical protein GWR56_19365 [Mucilaginibacter sp. 14171R-50]